LSEKTQNFLFVLSKTDDFGIRHDTKIALNFREGYCEIGKTPDQLFLFIALVKSLYSTAFRAQFFLEKKRKVLFFLTRPRRNTVF